MEPAEYKDEEWPCIRANAAGENAASEVNCCHCLYYVRGEWRESASGATVAVKNPCGGSKPVGYVQGKDSAKTIRDVMCARVCVCLTD